MAVATRPSAARSAPPMPPPHGAHGGAGSPARECPASHAPWCVEGAGGADEPPPARRSPGPLSRHGAPQVPRMPGSNGSSGPASGSSGPASGGRSAISKLALGYAAATPPPIPCSRSSPPPPPRPLVASLV